MKPIRKYNFPQFGTPQSSTKPWENRYSCIFFMRLKIVTTSLEGKLETVLKFENAHALLTSNSAFRNVSYNPTNIQTFLLCTECPSVRPTFSAVCVV